jgi:HK97 family phage prohead protease
MTTKPIIRKTHGSSELLGAKGKMFTFAVSAESTDRYGDQIVQTGIDLRNYLRNPIALMNHNTSDPIGNFLNPRIQNGKLTADLDLLPEGVSNRVDEIRALISHGVLRATSIGFAPVEQEPIVRNGARTGTRYTKSELYEISVVSVPAQSEALAIARSLGVSRSTMQQVFTNGSMVSEHIAAARQTVAQETAAQRAARVEARARATLQRLAEEEAIRYVNHPWNERQRQQEEAAERSAEYARRMEAETIAGLKAEGRYVDPNPPASGRTIMWRGQKIDLRTSWHGKKCDVER